MQQKIQPGQYTINGYTTNFDCGLFAKRTHNAFEIRLRDPLKINRFSFPEGSEVVPDRFFACCLQLEEVVLPEGIIEIGREAFKNCSMLKRLELPSTVEHIGDAVIYKSGVTEVVSHSIYVGLTDDCLIDNLTRSLIAYMGNDEEVVIPLNVRDIAPYAFAGKKNLKRVVVRENVVRISGDAFADCPNLKEVEIADTVDYSRGAFAGREVNIVTVESESTKETKRIIGFVPGKSENTEH